MKRVAVQLYGHLRSFEETAGYLYKNLINTNSSCGVVFDIFIHTWDEIDSKQIMPHYDKSKEFAGRKLTENQRKSVCKIYSPKKIIIEPQIKLTPEQRTIIEKNKYNENLAIVFNNVCHTFCSANNLRKEYEKEYNINYDLVIITRPDILFYSPLNLSPYFNKEGGFQFFDDESIKKYVFSTYINGYQSVINQKKYIAGLDLLLLGTPEAVNKLACWKDNINQLMNTYPEHALICMMNKHSLCHSFFIYEKDKNWTILRLNKKDRILHIAPPPLL